MSDNEFPRRNNLERMEPAEKAIMAAMEEVEKMPADTRLTQAIVLLSEAKDYVSNFIDGKE